MKKKKGWLLLIVSLISVVLVFGCTNQQNNLNNSNEGSGNGNTNQNDSNGNDSSNRLFKEPITLSMFNNSHPNFSYSKEQPMWDWIEEVTNVNIDMTAVEAASWTDQLNLTIASDDLPDLFWIIGFERAQKYGNQGAFVDMADYKDIMPNMFREFEKNEITMKRVMSADQKIYIAPSMNNGEGDRRIWMYREDIFVKHNLSTPSTWDELYDVSKQLKEIYPDSYPFNFRSFLFYNIAPGFGIENRYYADADGQYQFGAISDGYKTMVEYLKKFYEEGLIPATFLSNGRKEWQELMVQDKSFISTDYIGPIGVLNEAAQSGNPDFMLKFTPPPAGFDGAPQHNPRADYLPNGMSVSSTSDNIEEALKYIDWFYSDEGKALISWGKEGEIYETVNDDKQLTEAYRDISTNEIRKETGLNTNGSYLAVEDFYFLKQMASEEMQHAFVEAPKYDAPAQFMPPLTPEEEEETSILMQAINRSYEENIGKFIIGERDLSQWEQYKNEIENLGLPRLLEILQTAYDRIQ